jgi:tetratricopeptide (TPR) repeat protein
VGQALNRQGDAAQARKVLSDFAARSPESPLLPEVELAAIRSFECEGNWSEALLRYDSWLANHTNDPAVPQAEFARAWANYLGGRETNAFHDFTNFLARFPTNELAPRAQYWVADHYYRLGLFHDAELVYQTIPKHWPDSPLVNEAWMMAGRSAAASEEFGDAIPIYTNLAGKDAVPPSLRLRAAFAAGDATMSQPPDTNNLEAGFLNAIKIFSGIMSYTNEPISVLAQGRIADCYFQLAGLDPDPLHYYTLATNSYSGVVQSPLADVTARSGAEFGLARCSENMGRLDDSLDHYERVIYGANLREGEKLDIFWVKEAGLKACRLLDDAGQWEQLQGLSNKLIELVPPLQSTWEKWLVKARAHLTPASPSVE